MIKFASIARKKSHHPFSSLLRAIGYVLGYTWFWMQALGIAIYEQSVVFSMLGYLFVCTGERCILHSNDKAAQNKRENARVSNEMFKRTQVRAHQLIYCIYSLPQQKFLSLMRKKTMSSERSSQQYLWFSSGKNCDRVHSFSVDFILCIFVIRFLFVHVKYTLTHSLTRTHTHPRLNIYQPSRKSELRQFK